MWIGKEGYFTETRQMRSWSNTKLNPRYICADKDCCVYTFMIGRGLHVSGFSTIPTCKWIYWMVANNKICKYKMYSTIIADVQGYIEW